MEINNKQKNRNKPSNSQFNDEEETMTYMSEIKKVSYINTQEDVFKSVFNFFALNCNIRNNTIGNFNRSNTTWLSQFKVIGFTHDCLMSETQSGNRTTTVDLWIGVFLPLRVLKLPMPRRPSGAHI